MIVSPGPGSDTVAGVPLPPLALPEPLALLSPPLRQTGTV